jgi:1,4-alpha-glucan branching enzyme
MDWVNEAAAETYVPLLNMLGELASEGISAKVTLGITPVLAEMLAAPEFKGGFKHYLQMKIDAAIHDGEEFASFGQDLKQQLAAFWQSFYSGIKRDFEEKYGEDLLGAFRALQDGGHIEIITCAATHAYFPLLSRDESIQAQVKQGIAAYRKHFGRKPRGMWLPECAYRPRYEWANPLDEEPKPYARKGMDEFLGENGIEYFVVDSHLLKGGEAIGVYINRFEALRRLWAQFADQYKPREEDTERSPYELYLVSSIPPELLSYTPPAVLTRDPRSGLQVWSGEHGYPGDGRYLDFHKKHYPGGHRYWKVTSAKSDLADKMEYYPADAEAAVHPQADHFVDIIKNLLREHRDGSGSPGHLSAPYDTELFGHWWFEGVRWLKEVIRRMALDPEIELATGGEALDRLQPARVITLPEGSWGEGGFHYIWLNDWTKWTWRHIYDAESQMVDLARRFADSTDPALRRIMKQLARELMLLQSSDWQFLISTWSARDYAERRVAFHNDAFMKLDHMARRYGGGEPVAEGDWRYLAQLEEQDGLFGEVDPRWWKDIENPPQ